MLKKDNHATGREEKRPAYNPEYMLRLFVAGASPNSTRAVNNLTDICEELLKGKYKLEIIDVYQQPEIAKEEQIIALPMLIKKYPLPERRLIGDMSVRENVLRGLSLNEEKND